MAILFFFLAHHCSGNWQDNSQGDSKHYRPTERCGPLENALSMRDKVPKINHNCIGYEGNYEGYRKSDYKVN